MFAHPVNRIGATSLAALLVVLCTSPIALAGPIIISGMDPEDHGDPETLLEDLTNAEAEVAALRDSLKAILSEALAR